MRQSAQMNDLTRQLRLIALVALLAALAVMAPWIVVFNGPLSTTPADWGVFGDYIGGVLPPILMFFTILVAFQTIRQQQREISQLGRDAACHDLLEVIKMVEADFISELKRLNITYEVGNSRLSVTGEDVLLRPSFWDFKKILKPVGKIMEEANERNDDRLHPESIWVSEAFSMAAGHLNQLGQYVEAYGEVTNTNALAKYFERKYKLAFDRFIEAGFNVQRIDLEKVNLRDSGG